MASTVVTTKATNSANNTPTVIIDDQQQRHQLQIMASADANRGGAGGGGTATTKCDTFVQRTGLPENQLYRTIYHILLGSAFVTILPGVLTFVLTLRISIALGEARRRRKRLSHCCAQSMAHSGSSGGAGSTTTRTVLSNGTAERESFAENPMGEKQQHYRMVLLSGSITNGGKRPSLKRKEHRANVMLVVIIVKFLISDILPTVLDAFETFIGNEVFMASPLATLWVDFSNFLLVINCSTNFWVFLLYVRGFRQRCVRLITHSLQCNAQSPLHEEASCVSLRPGTPRANSGSFTHFGGAGGNHHNMRSQRGSGSDYGSEFGNKNSAQQNDNFAMPNLNGLYRKEGRMEQEASAAVARPKRASSLAIGMQQRHHFVPNCTSPLGAVPKPSAGAMPSAASANNSASTMAQTAPPLGQPAPRRTTIAASGKQQQFHKKGSLAAW